MTASAGNGRDGGSSAGEPALFPVRVGEIPARGVHRTFGIADLGAVVRDALDAEPSRFEARVELQPPDTGRGVIAMVGLDMGWSTGCDRCGEPVQVQLETKETLRYQPEDPSVPPGAEHEEVELEEDDLDVGWYRDGTLSLADVVSEAIALALPMRNVCEDTAGCDARTTKLLEGSAESAGGHPGFAALKNWT